MCDNKGMCQGGDCSSMGCGSGCDSQDRLAALELKEKMLQAKLDYVRKMKESLKTEKKS